MCRQFRRHLGRLRAEGTALYPSGPLAGVSAIRPLFEGLIAELSKPGASFGMTHQAIEGDYAYIVWTAETADNVYELATDAFIIQDGKIVTQSFAANITPKSE